MIEPGPGILLIADPFLKDPNFLRTVVFLCEHKEEGSFGFVLNRKYENTPDELIPDVKGFKLPVFYGGPVQMDTIHFLHQYPNDIPGGEEILKGVFWGGDLCLNFSQKLPARASAIFTFLAYRSFFFPY
jgi:putative transcriptional regulator